MKKTDLEKIKGRKLAGGGFGTPDRFGRGAAEPAERRAQRERDREQGLVPFACKLHHELVEQVQARARERGVGLSEIAEELIRKGLAAK